MAGRGGNIVLPLVILAGGATVVYVAVTNPVGGAFAGLGRVLRGEPAQNHPTGFAATAADLAAVVKPGRKGSRGGTVTTADGQVDKTPPTGAGARRKVLEASRGWLGVKYRWGGVDKTGVDCSGLTRRVYATVGVELPHLSAAQQTMGLRRNKHTATAGDLVFFGFPAHHVGIYLGDGRIRHAPHTGAVVRDEKIWGGEVVTYRDVITPKHQPKKHPTGTVSV